MLMGKLSCNHHQKRVQLIGANIGAVGNEDSARQVISFEGACKSR